MNVEQLKRKRTLTPDEMRAVARESGGDGYERVVVYRKTVSDTHLPTVAPRGECAYCDRRRERTRQAVANLRKRKKAKP